MTSGQAYRGTEHEQIFRRRPRGDCVNFAAVYHALRRIAEDARLTRVLEQRLFEIAEGFRHEETAGKNGRSMNTIKTEARRPSQTPSLEVRVR